MKRLLIFLFVTTPVWADTTHNGKTIDCYCTDKSGNRMELGEMTCLRVDGRMFMAQCQMSLNVPMWREVADGCLSSSLGQQSQPVLDTGGIDAKI